MTQHPLIVMACLALSCGCLAQMPAAAQPPAANAPQPTDVSPATRPARPPIQIVPQARRISLDAIIWHNDVELEVFACGPLGREHETVLILYNTAPELFDALKQIGAVFPIDLPEDEQAQIDLRGQRLLLTVEWSGPNGRMRRLAEQLMVDRVTGLPVPPVGWRYLATRRPPEPLTMDSGMEINLTYVGLRGPAEGVLELSWARQPFATNAYVPNPDLLPGDIPRPGGIPARLIIEPAGEAEALDRGMPNYAGDQIAEMFWRLSRPAALAADLALQAYVGPKLERVRAATQALAELSDANIEPASLSAQSAVAELQAAAADRDASRYEYARNIADVDLAWAQLGLLKMNVPEDRRAAAVEAQTESIRLMRRQRDSADLKMRAAQWQAAAALLAMDPQVNTPGPFPPLASPNDRATWARLEAERLGALAEVIALDERQREAERGLIRELQFLRRMAGQPGVELGQRSFDRQDLRLRLAETQRSLLEQTRSLIETRQRALAPMQWAERETLSPVIAQQSARLDELRSTAEYLTSMLALEAARDDYQLYSELSDSPEDRAQRDFALARMRELTARISALAATLGLALPEPIPGSTTAPASQPAESEPE